MGSGGGSHLKRACRFSSRVFKKVPERVVAKRKRGRGPKRNGVILRTPHLTGRKWKEEKRDPSVGFPREKQKTKKKEKLREKKFVGQSDESYTRLFSCFYLLILASLWRLFLLFYGLFSIA